jgi:diguanylate cyclase (GGDEF)-like protein
MSDTLREELRAHFAKAKMPTSPALAVQVLELAQNPDSTVEQFSDLIQMDPALAGRLLSMTNSAACAQRTPVTTIQRAVNLLGINRVRVVSLSFQLVGHLNRLGECAFDMRTFWQHSLLRACLAREFAETLVPACAEEAFLIGLLQDCGTILLVQLLGRPYAELCQSGNLSPTAFFAAEKARFRHNHVETVAALAREWKLPETMVIHLEMHHTAIPLTETSTDVELLSAVSYLVGSIRLTKDLHVDGNEPVLSQYAQTEMGLDTDAVQSCLDRAAQAYAEMGELLRGIVPDDLDVTDLLSQANAHLTESVEAERDRSVQERARLENALGEYRERAARDPLTGVLNRGALTNALRNSTQQAQRKGKPIVVLFLDIDNFKRLNDMLGHPAGDEVLKGLAETLKGCVPNAGSVGRYGGEEFLLVVPGLTEPDARRLAEDVVTRVRDMQFPGLGLPGPVTCSLGVIWGTPDRDTTAEDLVAAVDELMYEAKRLGKDCYCFRTLGSRNTVELLDSDAATVEACADALQMQSADPAVVPAVFQRIARELNSATPLRFVEMRKEARKELLVPCRLTTFAGMTLEPATEDAYVRNISTGGLALLAGRSIPRGQPAEVAIRIDDRPRFYVAGMAAFCRHVEGVVYEIGLQLFTYARQPILSYDPISAIRTLDWVADALRSAKSPIVANA